MLPITTLLKDINANGLLTCECPYGQLRIEADAPAQSIEFSFSNAQTFRYFLRSIPGFSLSRIFKYRKLGTKTGTSLRLFIDGTPLLNSQPESGWKANYWLGLKQWLLWKLGV